VDDNITGKRREVMRWRIERNEGWTVLILLTTSLLLVYLCHLFLQISSSLPVSLLPILQEREER
jgi:hypothetical protein